MAERQHATERETVLVTGASSGIGRELARRFAADGADLVLVARRRDALERLAAELCDGHRIAVHVLAADLARPDAPDEIAGRLAETGLTIDVVVNNAGFGLRGPAARLDRQRQLDMVQVNVTALTDLSRRFLPAMLERRRGGVLNVASTAAFQSGPGMAVYYATKAYVLSFTEALAEELSGSGVTVTCLCPGPTATEFAELADMAETPLFRRGTASAVGVARAGHQAFRQGRLIVIPGLKNKAGAASVRFAPRPVIRKLVKAMQA